MLPRTKRITEFVGILYARTVGGRVPTDENFIVELFFNRRRRNVIIFGIGNGRNGRRAFALFVVIEVCGVSLRIPACVENVVGVSVEIFVVVQFRVICSRGVVPTRKVETFAFAGRQIHFIPYRFIDGGNGRTGRRVKREFVRVYRIRYPVIRKITVGVFIRNFKKVFALFVQSYLVFVFFGGIRFSVYFYFVFGRAYDVIPG